MDKSEEKERGFKVEDRRRFSAEGELKPEHRAGEQEPFSPQAPPEQRASRQSGPTLAAAEGSSAPAKDASAGRESYRSAAQPAEITFATFIVGLSTQALLHLGEIPDPATGKPAQDLSAAQQLIDILGMLQEKTRSNLQPDEQNLLDAILFDLRMKYVEIARPAGR
jgi:uncharacterized protein DUF1844